MFVIMNAVVLVRQLYHRLMLLSSTFVFRVRDESWIESIPEPKADEWFFEVVSREWAMSGPENNFSGGLPKMVFDYSLSDSTASESSASSYTTESTTPTEISVRGPRKLAYPSRPFQDDEKDIKHPPFLRPKLNGASNFGQRDAVYHAQWEGSKQVWMSTDNKTDCDQSVATNRSSWSTTGLPAADIPSNPDVAGGHEKQQQRQEQREPQAEERQAREQPRSQIETRSPPPVAASAKEPVIVSGSIVQKIRGKSGVTAVFVPSSTSTNKPLMNQRTEVVAARDPFLATPKKLIVARDVKAVVSQKKKRSNSVLVAVIADAAGSNNESSIESGKNSIANPNSKATADILADISIAENEAGKIKRKMGRGQNVVNNPKNSKTATQRATSASVISNITAGSSKASKPRKSTNSSSSVLSGATAKSQKTRISVASNCTTDTSKTHKSKKSIASSTTVSVISNGTTSTSKKRKTQKSSGNRNGSITASVASTKGEAAKSGTSKTAVENNKNPKSKNRVSRRSTVRAAAVIAAKKKTVRSKTEKAASGNPETCSPPSLAGSANKSRKSMEKNHQATTPPKSGMSNIEKRKAAIERRKRKAALRANTKAKQDEASVKTSWWKRAMSTKPAPSEPSVVDAPKNKAIPESSGLRSGNIESVASEVSPAGKNSNSENEWQSREDPNTATVPDTFSFREAMEIGTKQATAAFHKGRDHISAALETVAAGIRFLPNFGPTTNSTVHETMPQDAKSPGKVESRIPLDNGDNKKGEKADTSNNGMVPHSSTDKKGEKSIESLETSVGVRTPRPVGSASVHAKTVALAQSSRHPEGKSSKKDSKKTFQEDSNQKKEPISGNTKNLKQQLKEQNHALPKTVTSPPQRKPDLPDNTKTPTDCSASSKIDFSASPSCKLSTASRTVAFADGLLESPSSSDEPIDRLEINIDNFRTDSFQSLVEKLRSNNKIVSLTLRRSSPQSNLNEVKTLFDAIQGLSNLQELRFWNTSPVDNHKDEEGLEAVCELLQRVPQLQSLRVGFGSGSIPDKLLEAIGNSLPNLKVVYLHAKSSCALSKLLIKSPKLQELYVVESSKILTSEKKSVASNDPDSDESTVVVDNTMDDYPEGERVMYSMAHLLPLVHALSSASHLRVLDLGPHICVSANALQVLAGALHGEKAPTNLKSLLFSYMPDRAVYLASKKKQALVNHELQDMLCNVVHHNTKLRVIKNHASNHVFVKTEHLMLQRALNYNSTMENFEFSGSAFPDEVFEDSFFGRFACIDLDTAPECGRVVAHCGRFEV